MIHIVLVILKIIGILLAVLLGIVLLFLLLILFCPVHYKMNGKYQDGIMLNICFTFLKPFLIINFDYDKDMKFKIRVLGVSILRDKQKETGEPAKKRKSIQPTVKEEPEPKEEPERLNESEIGEAPDKATDTITLNKKEKGIRRKKVKVKKSFYEKVKEKILSLKISIKKVIHSITSFPELLSKINEMWNDNKVRIGFQVLKDEIIFLLEKSKPKKYRCYVHYGTGDPFTTGQILGLFGMLYAVLGNGLVIQPDFEQKVFESEFHFKGKVFGIYALRFIWKLYKNKDINYIKKSIFKLRRNSINVRK